MKKENGNDSYDKIFREKSEPENTKDSWQEKKQTPREIKERKFILTFLIQSLICILIIGSIIITKYTNSRMFVSVSSVLNGIYEQNITLEDLGGIIEKNIMENDALTTFFNISTEE